MCAFAGFLKVCNITSYSIFNMMATIRYVAEYLGLAKNGQKYSVFAVVFNPRISFGIAFGRPSEDRL